MQTAIARDKPSRKLSWLTKTYSGSADFKSSRGLQPNWNDWAPSHLNLSARATEGVVDLAKRSKCTKCTDIKSRFLAQPVAFEILTVIGPSTDLCSQDSGRRIEQASGDKRATEFLLRRVSIAVQNGNAAAVNGTLPAGAEQTGIG